MTTPSIKIDPLMSATATQLVQSRNANVRVRSNSIVKVEEVGDTSQEDVLDQSMYANINAEWVNRKGRSDPSIFYFSRVLFHSPLERCLGDASVVNIDGESYDR